MEFPYNFCCVLLWLMHDYVVVCIYYTCIHVSIWWIADKAISFKHMSFWYLLLEQYQTTYGIDICTNKKMNQGCVPWRLKQKLSNLPKIMHINLIEKIMSFMFAKTHYLFVDVDNFFCKLTNFHTKFKSYTRPN